MQKISSEEKNVLTFGPSNTVVKEDSGNLRPFMCLSLFKL